MPNDTRDNIKSSERGLNGTALSIAYVIERLESGPPPMWLPCSVPIDDLDQASYFLRLCRVCNPHSYRLSQWFRSQTTTTIPEVS